MVPLLWLLAGQQQQKQWPSRAKQDWTGQALLRLFLKCDTALMLHQHSTAQHSTVPRSTVPRHHRALWSPLPTCNVGGFIWWLIIKANSTLLSVSEQMMDQCLQSHVDPLILRHWANQRIPHYSHVNNDNAGGGGGGKQKEIKNNCDKSGLFPQTDR